MSQRPSEKFIDIDKVFKDKNPGLYKWIPGFVMRFLKKLIHQEEINDALITGKDKHDAAFAEHCLNYLGAKVSSTGLNQIPKETGVVVASNHPLGGLDGIALIAETAKARDDVKFPVNDILTRLPNFEGVFIPVNKHGNNTRGNLEKIEKIYADKNCVLIFPAGLCSRKIDGIIQDLEWQKSFVSKAIKYQLPIIPTYIKGKNSNRFYNISNWRKALGIKANIEMILLPDEMFKQKGKHIHITYGPQINPSVFDKTYSINGWAQLLKSYIYKLEKNPTLDFNDYLKTLS